jgi:predicted AlkP superfamily pyrophosphatase or phosphodiesterase
MKPIILVLLIVFSGAIDGEAQKKAVFIIVDGISADVLEKLETPNLDDIAKRGGYTRSWLGGLAGGYSESPTISAVGYNHLLTGTWSNKHNVWDNDIHEPNYHYWNIFRIAKKSRPELTTAIFSSWTDNRTKLVGEGLPEAGNFKFDHAVDGFELDTITFPPTEDRKFMFDIDEHVSKEAASYIEEEGPDLSWVYLEYTDDIGHMFGDSPQYDDAIRKADVQVGRIWEAIKKREQKTGERWMIVVTTDHGRDAATGKDHGGQTPRERTTWIVTNADKLNAHFKDAPATTDIMPSILRFMEITIPEPVADELDGTPFLGPVSISNLEATRKGSSIEITWKPLDEKGDVSVQYALTNNFSTGEKDRYIFAGKAAVSKGAFKIKDIPQNSEVVKILVKAPLNTMNVWVVDRSFKPMKK